MRQALVWGWKGDYWAVDVALRTVLNANLFLRMQRMQGRWRWCGVSEKKGVGGWSAGHRQWFWMHLIHRAIMWCNSTLLVESRVYTIPQGTAQCSVLSGNYALFHKELHQVHHPPNLRQEAADSAVQFWSDGPPIQLIFMICTSSHLLIGKPRFLRRTRIAVWGWGGGFKSQFG